MATQIVTTTHVNLVGLVATSGTVDIFSSVEELSEYLKQKEKYFPVRTPMLGSSPDIYFVISWILQQTLGGSWTSLPRKG